MNTSLRHRTFWAIAIAVTFSQPAAASDGEGWDWMVAPYGWAASMSANLETDRPPLADGSTDTSFDDLVNKLDGAFQVHLEGQGETFGLLSDFTYVGLADERNLPRARAETDLDTRLFEVAGVWNASAGRNRGLDLFAGLRYIDLDFSTTLAPTNPLFGPATVRSSRSFSDLMLGARYTWDLSQHWALTLRGDGSFGDTDGTWNTSVVAQYRMQHGAWLFGYRYMRVSLKPDANAIELTMHGPEIGYGFKF